MSPSIVIRVNTEHVAPTYTYFEQLPTTDLRTLGNYRVHHFLGWTALLKHVDLPLFVRAPTREGVYWLNRDDLPPTSFAPFESLNATNFWKKKEKPYPFCHGNPTILDCMLAGYCRREISCCD